MPPDATQATPALPPEPVFDDILTSLGGKFGKPIPRQDHIVNTLAQIHIVQAIQEIGGQLGNCDKAAYPGYIKLLGEQAASVALVGASLVKFVVDRANSLGAPVPAELASVAALLGGANGASDLPSGVVNPSISPGPPKAPAAPAAPISPVPSST